MLAEFVVLAALAPPPDLVALGIVSGRTDRSTVILRSGGRTRIVTVGETAFGGTVVAIEASAVVLDFGEEKKRFPLAAVAVAPTTSVLPPPPRSGEDPTTPFRAMERQAVERRLGEEIPRILAETTLVPVTESGQITGFALTRLPEGSLLTDAGLRAGDVLTRVNGTSIDSLTTLIGLWPRLQHQNELHAVVIRDGRTVSLTVTLR